MISPSRVPLGLYVPGTSIVHRASPGAKMLVLAVYLVSTAVFVNTWQVALGCLAAVLALVTLVARVPLRALVRQLTGVLPVLIGVGLLLWWRTSGTAALTTVLVLLSSITAALLVTLTTRVAAMMDSFDRALRPCARFGLPVDQISLALTLTLRLIPMQVQMVGEVLDARKARGSRSAGLSPVAFGVPVIVRTILRARGVADALRARGAAD
ncbi:energy-coupling factor transporter transmembrane component T family protein [Corynebacterium terpenotabidum]|uniref:Biotin ABC transport system permease n=1 Tax=Corynebacterium terpenotabidum Y-11 TaxID=1200352 RepID=S4XH22_9CORY|nr:energy-coupling factor transporter transmembrane protein EcfT [Corynebacterium terpenotabidum]AGP30945.1 biotin ABC transport system permease [Corynebacterium terpenotabidum Y-11]